MRSTVDPRGKLAIVKTDRASGKIVEKRVVKNAITIEGAVAVLSQLYVPESIGGVETKINQLVLVTSVNYLIKTMKYPEARGSCTDQYCYMGLTWINTTNDSYSVQLAGITYNGYQVGEVVNINRDLLHVAMLSPPLEKQSGEVITYRWTISVPYTTV